MVHVAPFHFSASKEDLVLAKLYPTAVHATGEVHDTPVSSTSVAPTGLGVDWMVQVLPFHRSASDREGRPPIAVE